MSATSIETETVTLYLASISTIGYADQGPWGLFDTPKQAWQWLAAERMWEEDQQAWSDPDFEDRGYSQYVNQLENLGDDSEYAYDFEHVSVDMETAVGSLTAPTAFPHKDHDTGLEYRVDMVPGRYLTTEEQVAYLNGHASYRWVSETENGVIVAVGAPL